MITKQDLIDFSLRRPDIQTAVLYSRTSNSNTYGAGVSWQSYRGHIDASQGDVAANEVLWRFIHQSQAVLPKLGDKFDSADGSTWQISDETDTNVLSGIIFVKAVKHVQ